MPTIAFSTYQAAADRVRRGNPQPMDEAICDAYDRQLTHEPVARVWHDLPMAANAWRDTARHYREPT